MTVSIIIPCFNNGLFLKECLESVINQSFTDYECIIINDGSTDESDVIATDYCARFSNFHYIEQENKGVSAARNAGIQKSSGRFILFLDADDVLTVDALKAMTSCFDKNPNLLIVYSDCYTYGQSSKSNMITTFSLEELLIRNRIFVTSMIQKKDLLGEILFDEHISSADEDWEFWLHLLSKHRNRDVKKIDYPAFYYRSHENSAMSNLKKQNDKREKAFDYIYNKHKLVYQEFYPTYITLLNRKLFYEEKLNRIYNSKAYRLFNFIISLKKR